MRREVRLNLIVVVSVLALSLPGAVILVRKKLQPGSHSQFMPDPVPTRVAWNDPFDAPPRLRRAVPSLAEQWMDELASQHGGGGYARRGPERLPVMSPSRRAQLLTRDADAAVVMWWPTGSAEQANERAPRRWRVIGDPVAPAGDAWGLPEASGRVVESIDLGEATVPEPVRRQLERMAYAKPPRRVALIRVPLSPGAAGIEPEGLPDEHRVSLR